MVKDDVEAAVRIIAAHNKADGRLAAEDYAEYFNPRSGLTSPRESNMVIQDKHSASVLGVSGFYPDKYDWPGILWLNWFYVQEGCRGQGLGTTLLLATFEGCRKQRARKLYLDTSSDALYAAAIRLYERHGFVQEGVLKDYYGHGEDYIIMGLVL